MYRETRGKKVVEEFTQKLYVRLDAEKFYQKEEYLAVICCVIRHNLMENVESNTRNVFSKLIKWKIPLSRETIDWGFEILEAMNALK